jgi:hypothetical protein
MEQRDLLAGLPPLPRGYELLAAIGASLIVTAMIFTSPFSGWMFAASGLILAIQAIVYRTAIREFAETIIRKTGVERRRNKAILTALGGLVPVLWLVLVLTVVALPPAQPSSFVQLAWLLFVPLSLVWVLVHSYTWLGAAFRSAKPLRSKPIAAS